MSKRRSNLPIDLPKKTIDLIINVAQKFPKIEKVTVFGSRVLGNAKAGSDLDLAVTGELSDLKVLTAFQSFLEEETNIPYQMDVIDFNSLENEALREHILQHGQTLYRKSDMVK
jgi:predicted nucleotidyltransferase